MRAFSENGPIGKIVGFIAGIALLVLALMFSVVLLSVAVVIGLGAWGYFWWRTRALRRALRERPPGGTVIDGEAVIVEERLIVDGTAQTRQGDDGRT